MKKKTLKQSQPKSPILVVYQAKNKNWRGFCFPFDITCEAFSKDEAIKKLEKMVKIYIDGLKKYNYPRHLSIRRLSEKQDRIVFSRVIDKIAKKLKEDLLNYQCEKQKKEWEIILNNPTTFKYYYDNKLLSCY